jgi:aldose 1-epimerase
MATGQAGQAGQRSAVPVTGEQYTLAAGGYEAVVTELGAGLRELSFEGKPVVYGYQPDELPPGAAGQLLAPWPNRVDRGRYKFGDAEYQLDLSEPARGNAIHGLTRWASWLPVRQEPDSVLLRHQPHGFSGYPFALEIDTEYRLMAGTGLQVTVTASNRGRRAAPYGTGQHPYLTTGAPVVDEFELTLPTSRWLPADERGIPTGPAQDIEGTPYDFRRPRVIGATKIDHALTGLGRADDGRVWVRLRSGGAEVALWTGEGYRWLQVFTGDTLSEDRRRKALAVEPMTCPPNAFVTGDDLAVLSPGESVTHTWGIQATFS